MERQIKACRPLGRIYPCGISDAARLVVFRRPSGRTNSTLWSFQIAR
jgi:hypothetical protein